MWFGVPFQFLFGSFWAGLLLLQFTAAPKVPGQFEHWDLYGNAPNRPCREARVRGLDRSTIFNKPYCTHIFFRGPEVGLPWIYMHALYAEYHTTIPPNCSTIALVGYLRSLGLEYRVAGQGGWHQLEASRKQEWQWFETNGRAFTLRTTRDTPPDLAIDWFCDQ